MATNDPRQIFRGVSAAMGDVDARLSAALVSLRGGTEAYRRAAAIDPVSVPPAESAPTESDPIDDAIALLDEARRRLRAAQRRRA